MRSRQLVSWVRAIVAVAAIALLCSATAAQAADGDLDLAFGADGRVFTDFGSTRDFASSVAYQADGKIVAAGYSELASGGYDFALARYNSDGSLDATFGSDGKVLTDFESQTLDLAFGVAIQEDGKIVAAGVTRAPNVFDWDLALARYDADGTLDETFGAGGRVRTALFGGFAEGVAIQPDGKIVIVGSSLLDGLQFTLVRYNDDGTLDAGFGEGGIARAVDGEAKALVLQPDGKIVAGGYSRTGGDFAVARFTEAGDLDASFAADGVARTDFGGFSVAYALVLQPDGRLVATGVNDSSSTQTAPDFATARYLPDGSPDLGFGDGGTVLTDIGSDDAHAVALQSDGKILIAGNSTPFGFTIIRYGVDGTLDTSFGSLGVASPMVFGRISAAAVPSGPVRRIIVAGDFLDDFALVRVLAKDGAEEQLADLIVLVESYDLAKLGTSLRDKLVTVQRFLAAGKPRQAEEKLAAFIAEVNAQRGKGLSEAQADALAGAAQRLIDLIET